MYIHASRVFQISTLLIGGVIGSVAALAAAEDDAVGAGGAGTVSIASIPSTVEVSRQDGASAFALPTAFDVGVIPSNRGCPNGADPIRIHFDDEDDNNANTRAGYIGSTLSTTNTDFLFCRVDGRSLFSLVANSDLPETHYAVLKLGVVCPNESTEFARGFDNEDDDNGNHIDGTVGSIEPNVVDANAKLHFCLFRGGSATMQGFPASFPGVEPFGYGVFAANSFIRANSAGFVHTDDEDDDNTNSYEASPSILVDAQRIISGGSNTDLRISEVVVQH